MPFVSLAFAFALHVTLFAAMFVWIKSHFMYTDTVENIRSTLPIRFPNLSARVHETITLLYQHQYE